MQQTSGNSEAINKHLKSQLEQGCEIIYLEPRGDSKLKDEIVELAKKYGKEDDLYLLNFDKDVKSENSKSINPVL